MHISDDGILFDRFTMLRVRKTLERNSKQHEPALIDMHTGNDFADGNRRTDAVQYANHWAFVDSLWIGEGFSYNSPPDNWLLEISGMPFGVFSDMLGTPNQYRGMLFGSTGRFGCANPTPMWQFWDSFGIQATDMVGWWEPELPVTVAATNADGPIHATAYVAKGKKTLIALGSWSSTNATVKLTFDWATLGLSASSVKSLTAPAIANFQTAQTWSATDAIPVEPAKGWLLVVEPTVAEATAPTCEEAWRRLDREMEAAEATFRRSNAECLERCIPPTAPQNQPCEAVCDAADVEYDVACRGSGGLIVSERTVMRWALSLDQITTIRPLCIPTPDACDAHETQEIQRERQRQFCSTMGFFLLDQCNRFLDMSKGATRAKHDDTASTPLETLLQSYFE